MGIIQRQSISGTLFTYLGVIIGFITSALIFPRYLTTEQIGLIGIFLSYSYILVKLATFGTGRITIVMFPHFRDKARIHHGFFFLMIIIAAVGALSLVTKDLDAWKIYAGVPAKLVKERKKNLLEIARLIH